MTTVKTETGSIYEISADRKRVRRLNNTRGASTRAGFDGQWKDCLEANEPEIGHPLFIAWRWNEAKNVLETTLTSPVVTIEE